MPVRMGSGRSISFRYEPGYPADNPDFWTDFRKGIASQLDLSVT